MICQFHIWFDSCKNMIFRTKQKKWGVSKSYRNATGKKYKKDLQKWHKWEKQITYLSKPKKLWIAMRVLMQTWFNKLIWEGKRKQSSASGVKSPPLADCSWIRTRNLRYGDLEQMRLKCFAQGQKSIPPSEELMVGCKPGISCSCSALFTDSSSIPTQPLASEGHALSLRAMPITLLFTVSTLFCRPLFHGQLAKTHHCIPQILLS